MRSKFFEKIRNATEEKDVEFVYNEGFNTYFPKTQIQHNFKCDGLIETKTANGNKLKIIIEYKYDKDLKKRLDRATVLAQVVFYMKRFEDEGQILPNVCVIGDINECFVLHTNELQKYLDENVNWNLAPSNAHNCSDLVLQIAQNENINPFIFDIDDSFSFKDVVEKIISIADSTQRTVRVTEHNISTIFEYFRSNVVKDCGKIDPNTLVSTFIGVITNKDEYYIHPSKPNELVTPIKKIGVKNDGFKAFISHFNVAYSPKEKDRFSEIADRLVEDEKRRRSGQFYTPTLFVDNAHQIISSVIGEDWRERFLVWDSCWGTGNLTRDYQFSNLYASNKFESEMNIGQRYNPEAQKFIFDFLDNEFDGTILAKSAIPTSLIESLKNDEPIIFFINPPYGTSSSDFGCGDGTKGEGSTKTITLEEGKKYGLGNSIDNLYAQFLFRIVRICETFKLTNCYIGLFSPTIFLCGGGYDKFRNFFLKKFEFIKGQQFRASHFADVSDSWAISFSMWKVGETINKNEFAYESIDIVNGNIEIVDHRTLYNTDSESVVKMKDWIKEPIKGISVVEKPTFSSGIALKTGKNCKTKIAENALGCYSNMGNNVMQNNQKVSLFSSCDSSNANGLSVMEDNFDRVITAFSARRLIPTEWFNNADEYMAPNVSSDEWEQFVADCIVISLFDSKSNQASLRNIDFKDKTWIIKNEFFWMSKFDIMELANEFGFDSTYTEAKTANERFVYKRLYKQDKYQNLSPMAKDVLDAAIELTKKSFKFRIMFDEDSPEYQIMNWDCGYYQQKVLWEKFCKQDYMAFREKFIQLSEFLRPKVYEFGFLK